MDRIAQKRVQNEKGAPGRHSSLVPPQTLTFGGVEEKEEESKGHQKGPVRMKTEFGITKDKGVLRHSLGSFLFYVSVVSYLHHAIIFTSVLLWEMSAGSAQLITWHSLIEILRSRNFNVSESTEFAKQLYLGVERREQVFFKFTFVNILFICIQNKYLDSTYLEVVSYIFNSEKR